jgi:hypothetical protein
VGKDSEIWREVSFALFRGQNAGLSNYGRGPAANILHEAIRGILDTSGCFAALIKKFIALLRKTPLALASVAMAYMARR